MGKIGLTSNILRNKIPKVIKGNKRKLESRLYWDILDKKRLALLPKLKFLKDAGFYLAGGTALALQIKHRRSVDFDFYIQGNFDSEKILIHFQENGHNVILIQEAENTLIAKVEGIEISLFTYPYKLLKEFVEADYLNLASIEDISAMKLVAIIQRGIRRDFVDLYFLIKLLGLRKVFQLTEEKYPPFNKYLALQAITYFEDAQKEPARRKIVLFQTVSWDEIKNFITAQAREFKRTFLE